ncbi:hypothetical protein BV25DRAFT_352905 [Artomyces pyxidatus]|uniref:Uncharacterized protein n=1 Tax=Artomyces pyxidatus TaxID=48021 RepID=A0ACB8SGK7_9AGAM|nr:hypothetical protein BV25DRAFT_352905 [Artomyces pyxidatus]
MMRVRTSNKKAPSSFFHTLASGILSLHACVHRWYIVQFLFTSSLFPSGERDIFQARCETRPVTRRSRGQCHVQVTLASS